MPKADRVLIELTASIARGIAARGGRCTRPIKLKRVNDCIIWCGCIAVDGYGRLAINYEDVFVHRFSWELANNRTIPEGLCVLHTCDTPPCMNPDHLVLGTQLENIADRNRKNRQAKGERGGMAKLNEAKVKEIRALATNFTHRAIAKKFGVVHSTIKQIIHRETWKHVA